MADTYLILGGYTFSGFGVPEEVPGGGAQQLVVHKFLGGSRVIDAMGADDDPIKFKGMFRNADGIDAMGDAMLLDAMRRAGAPQVLTYWNQNIVVVIERFTFSFQRFYEVPYQIDLVVLSNAAQASQDGGATDDAAVSDDIGNAQGAAGGLSPVANALQPLTDAVQAVNGAVTEATQAVKQGISDAVQTAQGALQSIASAADTVLTPINDVIGAVNGVVDGAAGAANLIAAAANFTVGASAQVTLPFVGRIGINISAKGSKG